MGLIGKWSAIVAGCEQAAAELGYEGVAVVADARAQAFSECMGDLRAASTPRPPKVEYFGAPVDADGKPTGKWDSWAFSTSWDAEDWFVVRNESMRIVEENGLTAIAIGLYHCHYIRDIGMCIPVRREGPPAMDVGWDVVGG